MAVVGTLTINDGDWHNSAGWWKAKARNGQLFLRRP